MKIGLSLIFLAMASPAFAGPIETACNQSQRDASNPTLCQCIQQVADQTLAGADQRRAAKFFKNPEKANTAWQSQQGGDDAFWERYQYFGAQAALLCSPA